MRETELAGLVCARICHDLANPVGAIVNGADLIGELGGSDVSEELALIDQSARRAAALLQFHRLALGQPREPEDTIARAQLGERCVKVMGGPRVALDWSVPDGPALPMPAARLVALMLLAARAMLGLQGELKVLLAPDAVLPASVMATGPKISVSAAQRGWLSGQNPDLPDSRQIEFALIGPAARAAGAKLELTEGTVGAGGLALRALPL